MFPHIVLIFWKHRPSGPLLSISWFVRLFVCSRFEVPFKRLFAPTSRSWMFKMFIDSEFLGKSNGKKWSQIWKLLLIKGVKLPRKKNWFLGDFCLTEQDFLVLVFLTPFNGLCAPTSRSPIYKLFRFLESLGKSNGKKWSHIWKLLLIKGVKLPRKKS